MMLVYQGTWNFAVGHAVSGPLEHPPMPEGKLEPSLS
jgi:hypothetical protein